MLLTRRSLLAGSAALAANRSLAAVPASGEVDIVVVGAGAAGIAAARRIGAAGRRCVVIEATERVGGRCVTDTRMFGVPYDRGAHWIHMPDINPVAKLAPQSGFDIYPAAPGQRLRVGRRNGREGEMEEYLAALARTNRAIDEAAHGKTDISCAQALPKDLGTFRATIEFVLGPFGCGKDLSEVSVMDFAKSGERDMDSFCRQGYGALLAKLAEGLPIQLGTPVTYIEGGRGLSVQTSKGHFSARAAIVTVSTNVLAAERIKFDPELPRRVLDALGKLKLGSYDHVTLELTGNPLGLQRDELVFEKSENVRTAALLANISGSNLCIVDVAGRFGRELSAQGDSAMVAFALDWLSGLYGNDIRKAATRSHATHWNDEPFVLGAFSAAAPGGQPARRALMEPLNGRIWFAGEAVHETLWGTVGGAWESGERAAEAALRRIGALPELEEESPASTRRHRR
ncbi:MAG: flavin monoamine oxidase family protein [Xanthobacteraceae bacterium]